MNKCEQYCRIIQRLCNNEESPLLPPEYQQVEYIQTNTSSTSILTGVTTISNNTSFEMEFMRLDNGTGNLFSLRNDTYGGLYFGFSGGGLYQFGSVKSNITTIPTGVKSKYKTNKRVIYRYNYETGQYEQEKELSYQEFTVTGYLPLFVGYYNDFYSQYYVNARLYSFKLWEDATLQCELIPCYRKSDNVVGVYNRVLKQFITARTGNFIAGPAV